MFVTRATFNVVVESRDAAYRALERALRELERERERSDKHVEYNRTLVQTIVDMRRQTDGSFTPKPSMPDAQTLSDPLDDEIAARSKGNPSLRRHLLAIKATLRHANVEDDEIRAKLLNWQDPERDD